ncbi:DMT family transporter [Anaeromyxobacter paludicola]|uniref:EamA domain-containing protein n=1 Tax=Anaeromyxobacter paludicola TaxID=2918171 RepID=A0ABM7XD94_9BACT|nr:DMT family transporter [Anaeromyxobacter paludicola]BDG09845.1 hypothetical protein AMPC_29580 [Anaeromyxobacter paludicola]
MRTESKARLEIVLAALLFSTGGAAIKATTLGAWQVASLRSAVAAAALVLFIPEARRGFGRRSALVAVTYAATLTLFVTANKLTTSASAIFLQDTAPLYVLLLGPLLLRERVSRADLGFMVLVAAGMALFFFGADAPLRTAPDPLKGNVIAAVSGVTWALTILGLRWASADPEGGGPLAATVLGNALAFAACLPAALPLGPVRAADVAAILFLGVVQIGLAYFLLGRGVHHVRALEASLLLLVEPALNPIWSWAVHGERPGLPTMVGGALVIGATALKSYLDARARGAPEQATAAPGSG